MVTLNDLYGVELGVTVDFGCETATPIIRCKQGDKTRPIAIYPLEQGNKIVTVDDNGTTMINPTETNPKGSVTFRLQRPDGALYMLNIPDDDLSFFNWNTSEVQGSDHAYALDSVEFALTEDMLAVEGRALCDVQFEFYIGDKVSTASFYLDIEAKPTATASGGLSPSSPINIEEVAEESWGTFSPDLRTLYIVTGENSVKMYFGSTEVGGNGYNETQTDTVTDSVEEVTE